jgi:MYXO-CTERM domain-containing protein
MQLNMRLAASAAVALSSVSVANAGFVYSSANRTVEATAGATTDTASDSGFGTWFDSASVFATSSNALAQHGSQLSSTSMNFAGAAQASATSGGVANATSFAIIDFVSDMDQVVAFIVGLTSTGSGSGFNSVVVTLTDTTTSTVRLTASATAAFSGSLSLENGHSYRLVIDADAGVQGTGDSLGQYNVAFSTPIPAPGAAALLGLAGVVARRRRQR